MKLRVALIAALFAIASPAFAAKDAPNDNANDMAKERSHGQHGDCTSGRVDCSAAPEVVEVVPEVEEPTTILWEF